MSPSALPQRLARAAHDVLLTLVVPYLFCAFAYYGFHTNYTSGTFHEQGFLRQYTAGVYKPRVLGRWTLLRTHDLLKEHPNPLPTLKPMGFGAMDARGTAAFYDAYFLHNTAFQLLASLALYLALRRHTDRRTLTLVLLVANALMALTQYVVVPYDTPAWFLLIAAGALAFHKPSWHNMLALGTLGALGAAVRETALLLPAFYAAVNLPLLLPTRRSRSLIHIATLLTTTAATLGTWLALRSTAEGGDFFHSNLLVYNLTYGFSLLGLLTLLTLTTLLTANAPKPRQALLVLAFTTPWTLAVFTVGNAWEIRLFTPLWLLLLLLYRRTEETPEHNHKTIEKTTDPQPEAASAPLPQPPAASPPS